MYTVQWHDNDGNFQDRLFLSLHDAFSELKSVCFVSENVKLFGRKEEEYVLFFGKGGGRTPTSYCNNNKRVSDDW